MMGKASEMDIKTQALWAIPLIIYCISSMALQGQYAKCIVDACSKRKFEHEDAWVFRSCAHLSASSVSSGHVYKDSDIIS